MADEILPVDQTLEMAKFLGHAKYWAKLAGVPWVEISQESWGYHRQFIFNAKVKDRHRNPWVTQRAFGSSSIEGRITINGKPPE